MKQGDDISALSAERRFTLDFATPVPNSFDEVQIA
jgi:hypothetical protein